MYDIFKDADHLRRGMITRTQMSTALSVLGLSFSPREHDVLFKSFVTADGYFSYPACSAAVEESLSKAKGPAGGNGTKAARAIMQCGSVNTAGIIDEEEQALLENIENVIAKRSLSRRLDIFPVLEDLSHSRWAVAGHVTEGQFIRTMKDFNFDLTEKDLNTLLEKYCDTEYANEFNYMDFCKSIEKRLSKLTFLQSKFDLEEDTPKHKVPSGPIYANPYFDMGGNVRPFGSRPNSAQMRRPQYGNDVRPAGWRPGVLPGNITHHWW